jgi:hypothetical protein
LDKNEPFYIGIGSDSTYNRAYEIKKSRRNIVWSRITSKSEIEVEIMLDGLTWDEACEKEIEFIKLYGRLDLGNGILSNLTDGGDGTLGIIVSEEKRKKSSERHSGKNNPMYGKSHPKELIEQIRLKNIGRVSWNKGKTGIYSDSQLKKMSEINELNYLWLTQISNYIIFTITTKKIIIKIHLRLLNLKIQIYKFKKIMNILEINKMIILI